MKKKKRIASIIIHAILIFVSLIIIFPVVTTFFASFKTNTEIFTSPEKIFPEVWSWDNYKIALESEEFNVPSMIGNSFYYTIASLVISLLICTFAGYAFARGEFRGKKIWFAVFSALMFINLGSVTTYPKFDILALLHIPITLNGLIFTKLFSLPVIYVLLIRSYIHSLPKELDEAARIDGCTFLGTGVRIIFPLLTPIMATVSILIFQTSWNEYIGPMVYTLSNPEQRTLMVGLMNLKNTSSGASSWNLMLAGSVIALIPVLIIFFIGNKYIMAGLTEGSVKG